MFAESGLHRLWKQNLWGPQSEIVADDDQKANLLFIAKEELIAATLSTRAQFIHMY